MYSDVREHLRKQQAMNVQEIKGKQINLLNDKMYNYTNRVQEDFVGDTSWTFLFSGKILIFLTCVMLFSCYLYGGQDIKKGANLAFHDVYEKVTELENKEPRVQETMGYIRELYHDVKEYASDYFED